jgi:hypothetical protein
VRDWRRRVAVSFAFDLQAARPEIDMHALGLMAVLIDLIAEHGDGDRQCADHDIKHIRTGHNGFPPAQSCQRVKFSRAATIRVAD